MKNCINLALLVGSCLFALNSFAEHHEESDTVIIGDVEMTEVAHSDGFNQMKQMLGKWEGKLTQFTGAVINTSSEFKLVSGGNRITETLIEDGVEMLTTYSDNKDGELVVKQFGALVTQPVLKTTKESSDMVDVSLDGSQGGCHPEHHSYVSTMKWTVDADNKDLEVVGSTLYIDGEIIEQQSVISRVN